MARTITSEPEGRERDAAEVPGRRPMPFYPDFALMEAIVALGFLVVLLLLASLTKPSLEEVADPTASGYVPRPEWYFMWLFQTLKYFKGGMEAVGTFLLPTIAIGLLLAVPFIDRRQRRLHKLLPKTRPVRVWPRALGAVLIGTIATLTFVAYTTPTVAPGAKHELTEVEMAGQAIFEKMGCSSCHAIGGVGGTRGPDLTNFASEPDAKNRVLLHFSGIRTGDSMMPGYQLSDAELSSLAAYLLTLKGR